MQKKFGIYIIYQNGGKLILLRGHYTVSVIGDNVEIATGAQFWDQYK